MSVVVNGDCVLVNYFYRYCNQYLDKLNKAGVVTDEEKEMQINTLARMVEEYNEANLQKGSCFLPNCCFPCKSKQITLMDFDKHSNGE